MKGRSLVSFSSFLIFSPSRHLGPLLCLNIPERALFLTFVENLQHLPALMIGLNPDTLNIIAESESTIVSRTMLIPIID